MGVARGKDSHQLMILLSDGISSQSVDDGHENYRDSSAASDIRRRPDAQRWRGETGRCRGVVLSSSPARDVPLVPLAAERFAGKSRPEARTVGLLRGGRHL